MGTVWDRTTEVLSGRGAAMARIAFLGLFLPSVVRAGYAAYVGPAPTPPLILFGALLSLVIVCVLVWAQLALIALSSDPAATPATATGAASRRLWPALGIAVVIGVLFLVLLVPPFAVLFAGSTNFSPELIQAGVMPTVTPGAALFFSLYVLVFALFAIFLSARLAVTNAVVVNERLGFGAIARSFRLTRGSTWRIIGVLLLYAVVLIVATTAVRSIVGLIFRLILGADMLSTVTFLAAVATAAVTAALSTIAAAFVAQLYLATREQAGISIAR